MKIHTESSPNWREWGELKTTSIINAVALSIGVCPKWIQVTIQINPAHPIFKEIESEFSQRALVSSNRACEFDGWAATYPENQRLDAKVSIAGYATWALFVMKWHLPQEMAALAQINNSSGETTLPVSVDTQKFATKNINKIATKRAHALRSIIDMAKQNAINSNSTSDVYSELIKLADTKQGSLLGFVDGEGVKYQSDLGVKFYTKRMLREQLRRDRQ